MSKIYPAVIEFYRSIFARTLFYRFNKLLYMCSLHGMGLLNYENPGISGERLFLKRVLAEPGDGVIMDVGAHSGEYIRQIRAFDADSPIHAFEPHPRTFKRLNNTISASNIHLNNMAVGAAAGSLSLFDYADADGSEHASLYKSVIEELNHRKAVEHQVTVIPLDQYAREHGIQQIKLLKIDTEGHELAVLQGAIGLIKAGRIQIIQFEFNTSNVISRTYMKDFFDILTGYQLFRLLPDGMAKLGNYNPILHEIFAFQNIAAIRIQPA